MNKKAEKFKKYLDEKEIKYFTVDEINDNFKTVVFRSNIEINGQQLPTLIILDNSIYGMIRVLVAPKALNDDNKINLISLLNDLNKKYKAFKYYFDNDNNLVLDSCLLGPMDTIDGDLIYAILDVIVKHLNNEYKGLMKTIWQ